MNDINIHVACFKIKPECFSYLVYMSSLCNKGGQIPDATLIHLARKRRQQQRERGGEDFVPLDDTVKTEKKGSRLIRLNQYDH